MNMTKVELIEKLLTAYYVDMEELDDAYDTEFDALPVDEAGAVSSKALLDLNRRFAEKRTALKKSIAVAIANVEKWNPKLEGGAQ